MKNYYKGPNAKNSYTGHDIIIKPHIISLIDKFNKKILTVKIS